MIDEIFDFLSERFSLLFNEPKTDVLILSLEERMDDAECLVCGEGFSSNSDVYYCPSCNTPYHPDCFFYISKCSRFGCNEDSFELSVFESVSESEIEGTLFDFIERTAFSIFRDVKYFFRGMTKVKSSKIKFLNIEDILEKSSMDGVTDYHLSYKSNTGANHFRTDTCSGALDFANQHYRPGVFGYGLFCFFLGKHDVYQDSLTGVSHHYLDLYYCSKPSESEINIINHGEIMFLVRDD